MKRFHLWEITIKYLAHAYEQQDDEPSYVGLKPKTIVYNIIAPDFSKDLAVAQAIRATGSKEPEVLSCIDKGKIDYVINVEN